jgi:uncharacterized protein (DUF302 family)
MNHIKKQFSIIGIVSLIALMAFVVLIPNAEAQKGMMKAPDFHTIVSSKYNFDDTVDMLKGAIEAKNLMVIKEVDAQKMLRMVDVKTKGMKQLLFFHPRYMKSIMKTNKNATIEPPLKIVVMEKPDGKVMVKYIKPSYLFGRYVGMEKIGEELDTLVAGIVQSVQK